MFGIIFIKKRNKLLAQLKKELRLFHKKLQISLINLTIIIIITLNTMFHIFKQESILSLTQLLQLPQPQILNNQAKLIAKYWVKIYN